MLSCEVVEMANVTGMYLPHLRKGTREGTEVARSEIHIGWEEKEY